MAETKELKLTHNRFLIATYTQGNETDPHESYNEEEFIGTSIDYSTSDLARAIKRRAIQWSEGQPVDPVVEEEYERLQTSILEYAWLYGHRPLVDTILKKTTVARTDPFGPVPLPPRTSVDNEQGSTHFMGRRHRFYDPPPGIVEDNLDQEEVNKV